MAKAQIQEVFSPSTPIFDCTQAAAGVEQAGIYLGAIPYDGSASFRKGARLGPDAIRKVSYQLETFSCYQQSDLEDHLLFDLGNCRIKKQKESYQQISLFMEDGLKKGAKFLTLGGDHSISIAPIWAYQRHYSNLTIIHLDAHADLRQSYENNPHSHASIMARVLEGGSQLLQYGIRSGTRDEFLKMKELNSLFETKNQFYTAVEQAQGPLYLSLDLDYFDPSFMMGTGTPEVGGEDFASLITLLKILKNKKFVGADITELAPKIDPSGNSTIMASKVVREILLCLSLSAR